MINFSCQPSGCGILEEISDQNSDRNFDGNPVRKSSWLHQLCAIDLELEQKASFDEGLKVHCH